MMEVKKDIMTPKQRLQALMEGKPMDRILCMPIVTSNTSHLIGKTIKDYQIDGKVMAESHIAGYKRFGYDLLYIFTNCSYVAEAMGQELHYPEDDPAVCHNPIVQSREDLSKVKIAEKNDGKFPVFYEALDILNNTECIKNEVPMAVCFSGPLSSAATLRGAEDFVKDLYKDKELCEDLLKLALESCKNFVREIIARGAIPIILEPLSSGDLISPAMFKKFSLPYIKELVDLAHELGSPIPLHMCGKTHKVIGHMAESGSEILSIDKCDLALAREKVDGRCVILGNVSPSDELLFGPEDRIIEAGRHFIDSMKGYKPGGILATGCEVSHKVSWENLQTLMDVARSYGAYDYKLE